MGGTGEETRDGAGAPGDDSAPVDRPRHIAIPFGGITGPQGFDVWAETLGTVFDVDAGRELRSDFRFGFEGWDLGAILLARCGSDGHLFERSSRTIARSGIDHFLIQLCEEGGLTGAAERRDMAGTSGDICVFDLARSAKTASPDFRNTNLVVPRSLLAPLLGDPDALHGLVLKAETPRAHLLGHHLHQLARQLPRLDMLEAEALVEPTVQLVAGCLGPSFDARETAAKGIDHARLATIRTWIDRRLGDPDLGPDRICRHFGISRSALYRLFEPLGGIAAHIRTRRLGRCFHDLAAPRHRSALVSEIAFRWGFTNEASFSRMFRDAYGMTPMEVRRTAARRRRHQSVHEQSARDHGLMLSDWIQDLMRY